MRTRSLAILLGIAGIGFGLAASAKGGELDRTFPAAQAGTLTIRLDFGSVAINTHDADEIRLEAASRGVGASSIHFDARAEGDQVLLTGAAEPWLAYLRSAPGVRVQAWVPQGTAVRIQAPEAVEVERGDHPWTLLTP